MNIAILSEKIELQPEIKNRVLSFAENYDFKTVDDYQTDYFIYENMNEARISTQAELGEDEDGIKILACMLRAAVEAYEIYEDIGISDEIYYATMKCFPRFIKETYEMTGKLSFDRYWWTTRQVGCHLFRIGELEYEIKHIDSGAVIGLHIPSDADFSPVAVDESLRMAHEFFEKYYPQLKDAEYRCHSWLLDNHLKDMLGEGSNIINFQNRFEIYDEGETGTEFVEWVFKTKSTDYNNLPEETSLQRNLKKHILAGGVIRDAYGRLLKDKVIKE